MSKRITWTIEDHICRHCGGRVLKSASGVGATGGGNPVFRCADCGKGGASMGPTVVCWCGFEFRRNSFDTNPYRCERLDMAKDDPVLTEAFLSHGFDPKKPRCEVGIISDKVWRLLHNQPE